MVLWMAEILHTGTAFGGGQMESLSSNTQTPVGSVECQQNSLVLHHVHMTRMLINNIHREWYKSSMSKTSTAHWWCLFTMMAQFKECDMTSTQLEIPTVFDVFIMKQGVLAVIDWYQQVMWKCPNCWLYLRNSHPELFRWHNWKCYVILCLSGWQILVSASRNTLQYSSVM